MSKVLKFKPKETKSFDKEAFEAELTGAEIYARVVGCSKEQRTSMMITVFENHGVSTAALFAAERLGSPQAVQAKEVLAVKEGPVVVYKPEPATEMLRQHHCTLSAAQFNKLMIKLGMMEEVPYRNNRGCEKTFKRLIGKGLDYGVNRRRFKAIHSSQSLYFPERFMELYDIIKQHACS